MITVESASALGAADGHDFGTRQVMAVLDTLRENILRSPGERGSALTQTLALWSARHTEERAARRLELASRGATVEVLVAFELAWSSAHSMQMQIANAELEKLTVDKPQSSAPNRSARRKAKAAARKTLQ